MGCRRERTVKNEFTNILYYVRYQQSLRLPVTSLYIIGEGFAIFNAGTPLAQPTTRVLLKWSTYLKLALLKLHKNNLHSRISLTILTTINRIYKTIIYFKYLNLKKLQKSLSPYQFKITKIRILAGIPQTRIYLKRVL